MSRGSASHSIVVPPFGRRHWLWIGIALLVGAALRLWGLGEWSFWVDEGHTWRDATMPLTGERGFLSTDRVRYGIPFLLLRLLLGLGVTGYDEASVRLPFALVGIATVPAMAICGRRLVGAWPAVVSAMLLALNPWHVYWSQNARGYGLALLLCLLALHRAHLWHGTRSLRDLLLTLLLVALSAASHPTMGMLAAAFAGYLFVRRGFRSMLGARVTSAVAALVALVVLPVLIRVLHGYDLLPFGGFMNAKADPSLRHFVETSLYYFRPATLLAGLLGMLVAPRVLGRDRALFLICMVLVPMLVLTGVSASLVKVTARYGICALPVLTWLVALLLVVVARRVRATSLPLALLLPGLLAADSLRLDVAYYTSQHGQRARWREAAQFVRAEAARRGLAGVYAVSTNEPAMLYYLRRKHWFLMANDPHPGYAVQVLLRETIEGGLDRDSNRLHPPGVEAHVQWLRDQCGGGRLLAVMVTLPELREQDPAGAFEALLQQEFELALHLPCWVGPKDQSVYVYLPK
jgi:hypothetical protein